MKQINGENISYITIEKIHTGFLLIEPGGKKVHKQTINGVFNYLKTVFNIQEFETDNSPKTASTIEAILTTAIPKKHKKS